MDKLEKPYSDTYMNQISSNRLIHEKLKMHLPKIFYLHRKYMLQRPIFERIRHYVPWGLSEPNMNDFWSVAL